MGNSIKKLMSTPLVDLSQEDIKAIFTRGWQDPVFFCSYFLPHLFPTKMPWVHRGILAILTRKTDFLWHYGEVDKIVSNFVYERDGELHSIFKVVGRKIHLDLHRFTLLIMPRGFSKTTLAGVAFNIHNIVYMELGFAAYVSETARHAEMQMDNVKRELLANEKIKFFFGELKPGMQDEARWRQDFFETSTGMAMVARGSGGQVRGLNHNGQRPKMIVVDDVEDRESVQTPEQRDKTRKWAYADLMPALPAMDPAASILALGTLLHPDSLLMTWARDPQWTVVKFGAYDRQGDLLWPENMDQKKLDTELRSAVVANTVAEYYMERHSEIRLDKDRDFKVENFRYESPGRELLGFVSLYQDPAIGEKEKNDRCTFTVAGLTLSGKTVVLHQEGGRGIKPHEQIDTIFRLYKEWNPNRVGIESNAYQKALVHLVREEMFKRQTFFEVIPVTNTTAKHARIKGILQPRFANGAVLFAGKWPELEKELLEFPQNAHDDFADGLAGAVSLLDDGAFLAQDEETRDKPTPLEDEVGGDWRHAV